MVELNNWAHLNLAMVAAEITADLSVNASDKPWKKMVDSAIFNKKNPAASPKKVRNCLAGG